MGGKADAPLCWRGDPSAARSGVLSTHSTPPPIVGSCGAPKRRPVGSSTWLEPEKTRRLANMVGAIMSIRPRDGSSSA